MRKDSSNYPDIHFILRQYLSFAVKNARTFKCTGDSTSVFTLGLYEAAVTHTLGQKIIQNILPCLDMRMRCVDLNAFDAEQKLKLFAFFSLNAAKHSSSTATVKTHILRVHFINLNKHLKNNLCA